MRGDALYDMDSRMSRNFQCNAEYSMIENIEWKEMLLHCTVAMPYCSYTDFETQFLFKEVVSA